MADYNQNDYNQNASTSGSNFSSSQNSGSRDEQLRKLGQQLNKTPKNKKKGSKIIIILLVIILIALAAFAVWYFLQGKSDLEQGNVIRISMNLPEEIDGQVADIYKKDNLVTPGESYQVHCWVRNSNDYHDYDQSVSNQTAIYLRFKVELIVDDVTYNNMVIPDAREALWHKYNSDEEASDYVWDNYYYYYGKLNYGAAAALFENLTFDFENIPNSFGGKSAQIVISIEAVEANVNTLGTNGGPWETAPKTWINNMKAGKNNSGLPIEV